MLNRKLVVRASLIAALFATTTMAWAQNTKTILSGQTSVKLSTAFTSALQSLGVTPGTIAPSQLANGVVTFPITGGAIDLDTGLANIIHSGGLTLTAGNTEVRLQSFNIDTTTAPALTGLVVVDGKLIGRVPLFNLVPPSGLSLPLRPTAGNLLNLNGVNLTLTSTAAAALNKIFSVTAFAGGLDVGSANVSALLSSQ